MSRATDVLEGSKARFDRQAQWRPLWQELADVLYPSRANFTSALEPGQESGVDIYDSTPMQARSGLATAIDGLMKPSTSRWFWMKALNEDLADDDEAKRWFDTVGDRMWSAIYNPKAGFIQHSGAIDNDVATFGWGPLWIGENKDRDGLTFRSLFIGDVAIDENADGVIDRADIIRRFTARQALQRWKRDQLGPKVIEALDGKSTDREKVFEFVQCIYPRDDRDERKGDAKNLPYASEIICKEDEHIVEETGYHEFPMAIPRWEVSANQVYPRSPGMLALPDARTLQAMGHTLLVGGQLAVDPPRWVADDGLLSAVRTWPGGLTVINADTVKDTGGQPMGTLDFGANIPVGREMQDDYRRMVEAAFFKNVFNLPVEGPQMTAYEVAERKEEFLRTIGPAFGQLENSYIEPIVTRVFGIMVRAGAFPEAPEALQGTGARFEFMSPIQQAKRQSETAGLARAFELLEPLFQIKPDVGDNFDPDEIARDIPEAFNLRQKWLRTTDAVEQLRTQRAEDAKARQGMEEVAGMAGVGKTVADAAKSAAMAEKVAA